MKIDTSTVSDQPLFYVTTSSETPLRLDRFRAFASTKEADERLAVCAGCEHYRQALRQCKICNCMMPVKVRFKKASCPEKRW